MKQCSVLDWIAGTLVVVGALNWGLVGLLDFNLVKFIFGAAPAVARVVYVLVGLSGIYFTYTAAKCYGACKPNADK